MKIAGLWRRILVILINSLMILVTIGIYYIIMIVKFLRAKPNLGMKAMNLVYSKDKQIRLFLWSMLGNLFNCLAIPAFIQLVLICLKRGTWGEMWSHNYKIINQK